ncbi:MAG TPA: hypothetical protein VES95_09840 [Dermatophilaceae bacterium]|nr:hypothetical protein [Dermatophilaceae bacterium]
MLALDTTALRALLERDADPGDRPVLTLVLPVDPSDPENHRRRGSERWRVQLRNDLSDLAAPLQEDKAARTRFEGLRERAEAWLADHEASGRSLVLHVDEEEAVAIELPVVLEQEAGFGEPRVAALVRALCDHRLYAAVLVDREEARAVTGHLGFVDDLATIELGPEWGMPGPTRSGHQFRFEARQEKYQAKAHAAVAAEVDRLLDETPAIERLVLGGLETEAHGVARALAARSHRRLVGVVAIPMDSSDAELAERVRPHADAFERQQDHEAAAAFEAARGIGRAVSGPERTVRALEQYLARDVLVSAHLGDTDLVERVARLTVLTGVEVRFLHGEAAAALDADGGVGARLYYATEPAPVD